MSLDVITTVVTPASSYDLASLADIKIDLAIPTGTSFSTSADTASGQVLPFASTLGIALKQSVNGPGIQPGCIVSGLTSTAVTLSAVITGDVPAGAAIVFGADDTVDAFLARQISNNSAAIQSYCNRQFPVETIQDQFNFLGSAWGDDATVPRLQLSKVPLVAVTSVVTIDFDGNSTTLVLGTDFMIDQARGQLIHLDSDTGLPDRWLPYQTTVIYTAGYAVIPADLDDACSRMVKKAFWARGRDPMLMEQNQGGVVGSQKYWVNTSPTGNLPPEICEILDSYRMMVFA